MDKWNIVYRIERNGIKIIENINPIDDLDDAIKQCKALRNKFSDRFYAILWR